MSDEIFLNAEWRNLAMLNYEVEPALLARLVPAGTELDQWRGKTFVSLVGFRFLKTRVRGIPIPFHRNFDEVNLRFYVRRSQGAEVRRGVAFIREIVPRRAIAVMARRLYNENYVALPMDHRAESRNGSCLSVEYSWRAQSGWNRMRLTSAGEPALAQEGSEEQFITEHYWGYTAQRDGGTVEYHVVHPSWRVWSGRAAGFEGDVTDLYGRELAGILQQRPSSAFLAEGSAVTVSRPRRI
jgi:uncharacterized protein YqjF (DUF2071 family)